MQRVRRLLIRAGIFLVILVIAAGGGGYLYLRSSLPQMSGTIRVQGITAPVEIIRDIDAVPHIYAQRYSDALFGLGYVHAQDRLWQMEFQRRVGQGRLAEILGPDALESDRFLRTVGIYRAAEQAWERLDPTTRGLVEAYVSGINAFIATQKGKPLPIEFTILGAEPQPWTGTDVLAWQKGLAWNLGGNMTEELLHSDIIQHIGAERSQDVLLPYPDDGLNIVEHFEAGSGVDGRVSVATAGPRVQPARIASAEQLARLWMRVSELTGLNRSGSRNIGSNSWVVDSTKSRNGAPLLANDPHLSTQTPSIWYLAHLSAGDVEIIGATIPGLPAVLIGRNRTIAWGMTNLNPDVQDLYHEKLDPTGRMAQVQDGMEPLHVITETLAVKGQPAVEQVVRISRHGPLISDVLAQNPPAQPLPAQEALALRWAATESNDTTVAAFLQINQARDWGAFTTALRGYITPAQNFIYADVQGNIGYYAAGLLPIRSSGDGSVPAAGWSDDGMWTGWVAFDDLPHTYNPPEHLLVTANNRPAPPDYRYMLGTGWITSWRAGRIHELLQAGDRWGPDDFAAFQSDTVSLLARELLPNLVSRVSAQSPIEQQALDQLKGWDDDMRGDSPAAAIFGAWFQQLLPAVISDELGPPIADQYRWRVETVSGRFLVHTFAQPDSPWCDIQSTAAVETCADIANQTFQATVKDLEARLGSDVGAWQWGRLHIAVFPHQPLSGIPVLTYLLDRRVSFGGDWSTVNNGPYGFNNEFEQYSGPTYRQVIDLACLDCGRFIQAIGQSGHALSPDYDSYLSDWQAGRYRPMRFTPEAVKQAQAALLRLEPAERGE